MDGRGQRVCNALGSEKAVLERRACRALGQPVAVLRGDHISCRKASVTQPKMRFGSRFCAEVFNGRCLHAAGISRVDRLSHAEAATLAKISTHDLLELGEFAHGCGHCHRQACQKIGIEAIG